MDWSFYARGSGVGGAASVTWASNAWPAANRGIYVPMTFPCDANLYQVQFRPTNTTGNFDLAFYSPLGARIASLGTTAMANAIQTLSVAVHVFAGETYFVGVALSSGSGTAISGAVGGLEKCQGMGILQEASAVPLPATMTPVVVASDFVPLVVAGIR